jgi:putative membrane-bound dehydrogenase-like protein
MLLLSRPLLPKLILCLATLFLAQARTGLCQSALNKAVNEEGVFPVGEDGKSLNFGFENGTLDDWTVTGNAFKDQPIKGEISQNREFGQGKHADMQGEYWIGGYEKLKDGPKGKLISKPFKITHPWASFLLGGGSTPKTRVEIAGHKENVVVFTASGRNEENMGPVIVNLEKYMGRIAEIRIIDEESGGWGHVNFDDFRFYTKKPEFPKGANIIEPAPDANELYPLAGVTAEEAVKAMQLPPGFSANVGAAEPLLHQPIAMAIDDRGRIWVAEAFTYPIRAPEGKGKDRIVIFEDTDLDGSLDSRKVFAENLNLVSGLEVGFGGVWVGAAPYLLFIPDANGDDLPDAPAKVLLDGWGYEDTHETLNAFTWGPDGWLYGCHGVFTHSKVGKPGAADAQRQKLNAGIWRYHPTRHEFEVFAEGSSNPWGLDFNDRGQMFITACVIPHLYHVIHNARYQRQAGEHFNPYTYADIQTIARHRHYTGNQWNNDDRRRSDQLGGGHAHAGAMIYLGGSWPEKYRNQIFMHNIHGNRINQDQLSRSGSGFAGDFAPDFMLTRDQWSQMIYLTYGPDGQAWMIDWYDANQCHHRDVNGHDRSNGRLYRVAYNNAKPVKVDLAKLEDIALVAQLEDPNEWYVRHARRNLQERAAQGKLDPKVRKLVLDKLFSVEEEGQRLRYLWTAHVTGGLDPTTAAKLLSDKSEYVRAWTIQLVLEQTSRSDMQAIKAKLAELAKTDPSPVVRLYLASEVFELAVKDRWNILEGLLSHAEDASDHNLPLMYWYGLEPMSDLDPQRALALAFSASEAFPMLGQFMVRKLGGEGDKSLQLLVQGLANTPDDRIRLTFLSGLAAAMKGKRKLEPPKEWADVYSKLKNSGNARIKLLANGLALTFGMAEAVMPLREMIMRNTESLPQRREALAFLVKSKPEGALEVLQALLKDKDLRSEALRGLAEFDETSTPTAILAVYKDFAPAEKRDALATLSSRVPYAKAMLQALEAKTIASTDVTADLVRQLKALNDAEVTKLLESVWGSVRESTADRRAVIADYKALITHPQASAADLELGRALFSKTCQQCHTLFGTGAQIGPELTGANRSNLDYLLSNVLDPSAVLAKEYQPNIIETDSGRIITGIIKRKEAGALVVQTATESVTIPESEIVENTPSPLSMMPEDQLKPFSPHEVRSLFAYLGSPGQSPILATEENVANFFNGKDLTLWRGEEGLWKVENGEIIGKTPAIDHNTFLMSEMSVEDFRLTLEVKLIGDLGNSGIQIRSAPIEHGEMKGYQCDIGPGWWGKLYEENGRALLWDKSGEAHVKKGEWNKYEIVAIGSRVRSFINGQPCVDLDDPEGARRGVIAFQMHSGPAMEVRFKNIKLEVLSQKPTKTSANLGFPTQSPNAEPKFKRTVIESVFRSEGATTGDFNNDGLLDIAAGSVWYEAPDWKMHSLLEKPNEFDKKTYGDTFCNFVNDFNKDGRLDLLVVDFPGKPTWWFENPGSKGGIWKKTLCVNETNNESPTYLDINKDGVGELVFGFEKQQMGLANPGLSPTADWVKRAISEEKAPGTEKFSHGLGVGDINGDGLTDVVTTAGWWEAPQDNAAGKWKFHATPLGEACSHMQIFDYDGDGDADILSASAHRVGVWYYEQTPEGWKTHEIDKSCAQTHATCLADMNGDGLPDLVTGKRYYAHNGRDPGEDEPPMLLWYELKRENGKATWVKHIIDENSGVGTQFEVADVNRDGDLDIVIANKHGVFYFEQTRK